MKTLYSTALIAALAIGILVAASPGKAEAGHRGPSVSFSVVAPPFGFSIGTPYPYYDDYYYYPAPVYMAPPYPVYERPYYGYYGPYYDRHRHWRHRGDWDRHRHGRRY